MSSSIDDNAYFEVMMSNAWKLKESGPAKKAWSGEVGAGAAGRSTTSASRTAPFGTTDVATDYSTNLRPVQGIQPRN